MPESSNSSTTKNAVFDLLGDTCANCGYVCPPGVNKATLLLREFGKNGASWCKPKNGQYYQFIGQALTSLMRKEDKFRLWCMNCCGLAAEKQKQEKAK